MNNERSPDASKGPDTSVRHDESGEAVNIVERDLRDQDDAKKGVDRVITPSSTRVKEQEAEKINEKADEVERKLADD